MVVPCLIYPQGSLFWEYPRCGECHELSPLHAIDCDFRPATCENCMRRMEQWRYPTHHETCSRKRQKIRARSARRYAPYSRPPPDNGGVGFRPGTPIPTEHTGGDTTASPTYSGPASSEDSPDRAAVSSPSSHDFIDESLFYSHFGDSDSRAQNEPCNDSTHGAEHNRPSPCESVPTAKLVSVGWALESADMGGSGTDMAELDCAAVVEYKRIMYEMHSKFISVET